MTLRTRPPRLYDWQARLAALCADRAQAPFAWGAHDCCLWAADVVHALTGSDPAADWRGRYASAAQAARTLTRMGGLRAIATHALGEAVPPLCACVGDVVLISQPHAEHGQREALGVCNGASILAPGPHGLQALGMGAAVAAWKV